MTAKLPPDERNTKMTDREAAEKWLSDSAADGVEVGDVIAKMTPVNAAIAGYEAALAHARSAEPPAERQPKRVNEGSTHWDGCWREHHECAMAELERRIAEAERQQQEPQRPLDDEGLALLRRATADLMHFCVSDNLCRELNAYLAKPRTAAKQMTEADVDEAMRLHRKSIEWYGAHEKLEAHLMQFVGSSKVDPDSQMTEADGPWKSAVIDALIVDGIYSNEHENDTRKAIADLLAWECRLALDPAVSKEAAALRDSGRMTEADVDVLMNHVFNAREYALHADWDSVRYAEDAVKEHLMQFVVSGG